MEQILVIIESVEQKLEAESLSKGKPRNIEVIREHMNVCKLLVREALLNSTEGLDAILRKIHEFVKEAGTIPTNGEPQEEEVVNQEVSTDAQPGSSEV